MKNLICVVVVIFMLFVGCGSDGGSGEESILVDDISLPGTYTLTSIKESDAQLDFLSGFITFNADNTLSGEVLFDNPANDCVFDGKWSVQDVGLVIDIYDTTNSTLFDFGRIVTYAGFFRGDLRISFQTDDIYYTLYYQ